MSNFEDAIDLESAFQDFYSGLPDFVYVDPDTDSPLVDLFLKQALSNLKKNPDDARSNAIAGQIFHNRAEHEKAIPFLAKAVEKIPDRYELMMYYGWSLFHQKEYSAAIPFLDAAHPARPKDPYGFFMRGYARIKSDQIEEGLKLLQQSVPHFSEVEEIFKKEVREARQFLRRSRIQNPVPPGP